MKLLICFLMVLLPFAATASPAGLARQSITPAPSSQLRHSVIYNGRDLVENSVSWRSVVQINVGSYRCTGVFISRRAIVASAHCVEHNPDADILGLSLFRGAEVVDSLYFENTPGTKDNFSMFMKTEYFTTGKVDDDLLVIVFTEDILPEEEYRPALWIDASMNFDWNELVGQKVFMVGSGITGNKSDENKLRVSTGVVQPFTPVYGGIYVKGLEGQGICKGDSGGPLFFERQGQLYVVGVLSGGYNTPGDLGDDETCFVHFSHTRLGEGEQAWIEAFL